LTGLGFLILGLLVYLRNPTRLSTMFCSLSLLFAVVFQYGVGQILRVFGWRKRSSRLSSPYANKL
jgi:hypothetical protein